MQAAVAVIHESQRNADLATKSDIHGVRSELKEVRNELKLEIVGIIRGTQAR